MFNFWCLPVVWTAWSATPGWQGGGGVKEAQKKGRLHWARHGTAHREDEMRSHSGCWDERFPRNSRVAGSKQSTPASGCPPASGRPPASLSCGAGLYMLMLCPILSSSLPSLREHKMHLFLRPFSNFTWLWNKIPEVLGLWEIGDMRTDSFQCSCFSIQMTSNILKQGKAWISSGFHSELHSWADNLKTLG